MEPKELILIQKEWCILFKKICFTIMKVPLWIQCTYSEGWYRYCEVTLIKKRYIYIWKKCEIKISVKSYHMSLTLETDILCA